MLLGGPCGHGESFPESRLIVRLIPFFSPSKPFNVSRREDLPLPGSFMLIILIVFLLFFFMRQYCPVLRFVGLRKPLSHISRSPSPIVFRAV